MYILFTYIQYTPFYTQKERSFPMQNNEDDYLENVTENSEIVDEGFQGSDQTQDFYHDSYQSYGEDSYDQTTPSHSSSSDSDTFHTFFQNDLSPEDQRAELFAYVSLFSGVIALLAICGCQGIGVVLGIIAIVTGFLSKYEYDFKDIKAILGILVGIVAIILNLVSLVFSSLLHSFFSFLF